MPCLPPSTSSATIVDFMAIIQSVNKSGLETFGDLAKRIEKIIMSNFMESDVVALVPDRYDVQHSIKADERSRRTKEVSKEVSLSNDN